MTRKTNSNKSKYTLWHRLKGHDYEPFWHEDKNQGVFFACSICGYLMPIGKSINVNAKSFEDWVKLKE